MHGKTISRYIRYTRPSSYWDVVCRHLPMALVTGIPLVLALTVTPDKLPLMPCTFKALTGFPCPFCGFTRSFWAMASGEWGFAFYNCPLACVVFVLCILSFIWNIAGLFSGLKIHGIWNSRLKSGSVASLFLISILMVLLNWGYRLMEGLK